MQTLHIELQEGFHDDRVVARLNGVEVLSLDHVTTRMQTGFAGAGSTEADDGKAVLEISLPALGQQASTEINLIQATWAGVNVGPDKAIQFRISQAPFGYV
jgi:hypothetical protein